MATRFYLRSTGSTPVSPSFNGADSWEVTGGAGRYPMGTTKLGTALATESASTATDDDYNVLLAQFVSEPLAAQVIGGTFEGLVGFRESSTAANYYTQVTVRLVSSTGAHKVTMQGQTTTGGSEISSSSNYYTAQVPRAGAANLTPVVVADGDHLVVEIGFRRSEGSTTAYTGYIRFGDGLASDATAINQSTASYNSWVEFSDDIYFQGDSDVPDYVGTFPSTAVATGSGSAWSTPENVTALDGSLASIAESGGFTPSWVTSQILRTTGFDFNIPTGNTLLGLVVLARNADVATSQYYGAFLDARLLLNGTPVGDTLGGGLEPFNQTDVDVGAGSNNNLWSSGVTIADLNAGNVGCDVRMQVYGAPLGSTTLRVDAIELIAIHAPPPNAPPSLTSGPTVSYGILSRTGPENTPITVAFTYTDEEETGADELSYTIDTDVVGFGTEVGSGTMTSGVEKVHNIAYNAAGLVEGTNTLYVHVSDGIAFSTDNPSFTVLRDDTAPVIGTITVFPDVVESE